MASNRIDELGVNAIRALAMDAVQKANSGHPGAPMGAAPMAYALWTRFLRHNPENPEWPNRDRFVLSAGHASMLLYALLHLSGYDLSLEELQRFRQWDSHTPGHPERHNTPGVELTTGPLGAGFAMGIGMAIAERFLAARYNRPGYPVVDHRVYGIVSDGDLMEGVASEAASLAGTLGLGKIVYLYDDNEISIEGDTDITFRESVGARFLAYGWHVDEVADGTDIDAITSAIENARAEESRPSLITVHTTIAYGSPNKAGSAGAHGAPLGEDEVRLSKRALGWPEEPPFFVPDDVRADMGQASVRGRAHETKWNAMLDIYERTYPELAAERRADLAGTLPADWDAALPTFSPEDGPIATRVASGKALNAIAGTLPTLIGGSADLAPSTNTYLDGYDDQTADSPGGRNLHFGVREHAMGNLVNGMALYGGVLPFGATFLIFSDYMRPALRLAALQQVHAAFVFTHDSIGVGEDGPTHQPIEQLTSIRAIPGLTLYRPADANETVACWRLVIERDEPAVLALSRQGLPVLADIERVHAGVPRGGYVLVEAPGEASGETPDLLLLATGSEVSLACAARERLSERGIGARVVSMPSWELFDQQPTDYRDHVLPPAVRARVSVEAGTTIGWHRYVGDHGEVIGLDRFGASAPAAVLHEQFGFTAEAVADRAAQVMERETTSLT